MNDLNLTMFYKTSIDVEATDPDKELLWVLICNIRYWMTSKWRKRGVELPSDNATWVRLKAGATIIDGKGIVRLRSKVFYDEGKPNKWACSIEETITESRFAPRTWITEVGVALESSSKGTVSLVLTYGDRPGFLGPCQQAPTATIPRIVDIIANDRMLRCSTSGLELSLKPRELRVGDFPSFWTLVADEGRETPIIYVSPFFSDGNAQLAVDPDVLAGALGPSAIVFFSKDQDFCNELAMMVPSSMLRCSAGAIRAYATHPRMSEERDWSRHRYFTRDAITDMGSDELTAMFRRAYAQDVQFHESMVRVSSVSDMVFKSTIENRTDRTVEAIRSEAAETESVALALVSESGDNLTLVNREKAALEDENKRLKAEIRNLDLKVAAYEDALKYGRPDEMPITLWSWPQTPQELVAAFREVCDDRLVFTQRAIESLDECRTAPDVLWNALHDLRTIAYELHAAKPGKDIAREFNNSSTFEYARGAGAMTRKDSALMAQYFDEYEGRRINVEAHIKNGNKESDPKFVRIYFGFDDASRKIIVSSVGGHLDNYTGKFMR
ncbi:MAG: hypothetical protein IJ087_11585 [Eggerthellaceae bacterium]|nr:hypothetical protein [Eggerthellaceae bacterium]